MSWTLLIRQIETIELQMQSLAAQLSAMKATANALMIEPLAMPACDHAETENTGTFGAPEYRCSLCKAVLP